MNKNIFSKHDLSILFILFFFKMNNKIFFLSRYDPLISHTSVLEKELRRIDCTLKLQGSLELSRGYLIEVYDLSHVYNLWH